MTFLGIEYYNTDRNQIFIDVRNFQGIFKRKRLIFMLIYLYAIAVVLLGIACTLCPIIGDYHVLKKMGESGWISLIPWYSLYVKYTKVWCRSAAVLPVLLALPLSFLRSYSSNPVILKLLFLSGIAFFCR